MRSPVRASSTHRTTKTGQRRFQHITIRNVFGFGWLHFIRLRQLNRLHIGGSTGEALLGNVETQGDMEGARLVASGGSEIAEWIIIGALQLSRWEASAVGTGYGHR
jgi:hypothetical protein